MKKNIALFYTRVLLILFAIATIIILWMAYKDIDSNIAFKFGIGYLFFTFFLILYISFVTFFNLRKIKWIEIKKRLIKFIALFILFSASNYILACVFRYSKTDLYRIFSGPLGLAFGISFIDVILLKKKDN